MVDMYLSCTYMTLRFCSSCIGIYTKHIWVQLDHNSFGVGIPLHVDHLNHEKKYDFPLNSGSLIRIRIMADYNPYIIG